MDLGLVDFRLKLTWSPFFAFAVRGHSEYIATMVDTSGSMTPNCLNAQKKRVLANPGG